VQVRRPNIQESALSLAYKNMVSRLGKTLWGRFLISWILLVSGSVGVLNAQPVSVTNLQTEYLEDPPGIDVLSPRFSWVVESSSSEASQSAYQILAATSRKQLKVGKADAWNTGKTSSDQSVNVTYKGTSLQSGTTYYWKVRVWNGAGQVSAWSEVATWSMGLTDPGDWKAKWIGSASDTVKAAPLYRKAFGLNEKPIERAVIYVSGLGYYELQLNGEKVGEHVLDPAFTDYEERVLYETYDVTDQLRQGRNAVGLMLGNGWYNMHTPATWNFDEAPWRDAPKLLFQLEVTYADGTTRQVVSDASWKTASGPVTYNSIRSGESYDARRETPGWSRAAFEDAAWETAQVVRRPKGRLQAQMMQPMRVMKTLTPKSVRKQDDDTYLVDMGQAMAGWVRVRMEGDAGTRVDIRYGERLYDDGSLDQEEIGKFIENGRVQRDTYILNGAGTEVYAPRFTYHGFQYVEIEGYPGKLTREDIRGKVVYTSFDRAGHFTSSDSLLNQIQHNTRWSYIGNFHGYPTDCPHREKNGWTGDVQLAAQLGLLNYQSAAAYTKWLNDVRDAQSESGKVPGIVPTGGWGYNIEFRGEPAGFGPAWDGAYILVPWYLYLYRGDTTVLEKHYEGMREYLSYLSLYADEYILNVGLGDWAPADTEVPTVVTSTGYYYRLKDIMSRIASVLGKDQEAKQFSAQARQIKQAFNERFFEPETGYYADSSQTALSMALHFGLVEKEHQQEVVDNLVASIEKNDGNLDTGILGTKFLLRALTSYGRTDTAYRVVQQRDFPGWGYWIEQGATTLWEQWDGTQSRLHVFFGDVSAWFYEALAGMRPDPENPGFKHTIVKPHVPSDLEWVEARHESPYGTISSRWKKEDGQLVLDVEVPANATATILVPTPSVDAVEASGTSADQASRAGRKKGRAAFEVGAGNYRFTAPLGAGG